MGTITVHAAILLRIVQSAVRFGSGDVTLAGTGLAAIGPIHRG
jgi:hypothetical protein